MKTSTMTVKGQVTVPKELRTAFGWKAGDEVEFVREEDGVKIVRPRRRSKGEQVVARLRGAAWDRAISTGRLMEMTRGRGK
ncbi:MAG TPA: AbrB/MazE/SpoVT family DNA-binding domain-containing protein [Thermoanaerobaculia bacterium]